MKRVGFVTAVLFFLFTVGMALAAGRDEYIFQFGLDGYEETADTHITEYTGNNMNNMGGNLENEVCEYDPVNTDGKSVLIRFELSLDEVDIGIPQNAILKSATLVLNMTSTRNGANEKEVATHRLLKTWNEGVGVGIDGNAAKADEVCGIWTGTGEDWAVVGADGPREDFVAEAEDVIEIVGDIEAYEWDVTEMVQFWVANPDENYGLILLEPRPYAQTLGTKVFASKENPNPDLRPMLIVYVGAYAVGPAKKLATVWGGVKSGI